MSTEPKIPIWTVKINGQTFWTDSEEGAKLIIKALGNIESIVELPKPLVDQGTWDDLVKEAFK